MIDFSGYTKQAIEADMLAQVDPNIDTREGSMVQTSDLCHYGTGILIQSGSPVLGPCIWTDAACSKIRR